MKWCKILNVDFDRIAPSSKLCERHFDPRFLGAKHLIRHSIPPVIPLANNNELNDQNMENSQQGPELSNSTSCSPHLEIEIKSECITEDMDQTEFLCEDEPSDQVRVVNEPLVESDNITPELAHLSSKSKTSLKTYEKKKTKFLNCHCDCHKSDETTTKLLGLIEKEKTMNKELNIEAELYAQQIVELKKKLKKTEGELHTYKAKVSAFSKSVICVSKTKQTEARKFAEMICSTISKYSKDQMDLAQCLADKFPKCYAFLRDELCFHLPHPQKLRERQIYFKKVVKSSLSFYSTENTATRDDHSIGEDVIVIK
uniref:THAP-type domain-containing protein n=1 Tax=Stomoxys calcitrans TaxID=35570 RepID=A0A1I8P0M5_STOCA